MKLRDGLIFAGLNFEKWEDDSTEKLIEKKCENSKKVSFENIVWKFSIIKQLKHKYSVSLDLMAHVRVGRMCLLALMADFRRQMNNLW